MDSRLRLSQCLIITSAVRIRAMRPDRIVPLRQHPTRLESYSDPIVEFRLLVRGVFFPVQASLATHSGLGPRCANVLHDRLVVDQWLSRPVDADCAEQFVLDRIPFRRPRWIVGY